jgi:ABC-type nickel/cobalt efflux system permease component RcnA
MITLIQALASASVVAEEIDPDSQEALIDGALPIAGTFVLVLGFAMFLLWRSMSKQMKRIDPALPDGPDDREQARDRAITREAVERGESAAPDDAAR